MYVSWSAVGQQKLGKYPAVFKSSFAQELAVLSVMFWHQMMPNSIVYYRCNSNVMIASLGMF